jgi:hypothetical protein
MFWQGSGAARRKGWMRVRVIAAVYPRHCERSEAIQLGTAKTDGLLRRFAPRNDGENLCWAV